MKSFAPITALSLGLLASTAVHASSAVVSLSNLQIRLVDLDLSDGITPAFTAESPSAWLQAGEKQLHANSFGPLAPLSRVDSFGKSTAQVLGGDPFSSSGWAATASVDRTVNDSSGIVGIHLPFTLTTNTLLLITGNFSAQLSATRGDFTLAQSQLLVTFDNDAVKTTNTVNRLIYADGFQDSNGGDLVQASYANVTGRTVNGFLDLDLWAHVDTATTSAVPEPASIALMIGGLAFVGAFAGRRTRRQG